MTQDTNKPVLINSTTLQWPNGDTLEWTGFKFLFNGEDLKEPESQEEKCENEGCLGIHTTTCSQLLSEGGEIDMVSKKPQEKEECKHENILEGQIGHVWFERAWCSDCEKWLVEPSENPQPKEEQLKPGEWIEERANELIRAGLTMDTAKHCATLDFLDSVAEGKYKLEP